MLSNWHYPAPLVSAYVSSRAVHLDGGGVMRLMLNELSCSPAPTWSVP